MNKHTITFLLFFLIVNFTHARTYYSRATGNWNSSSTWSTVSFASATNTGTFPVSGDTVLINNGVTVTINANSAADQIVVGQGTSGILAFGNGGGYTLTITKELVINSGAVFYYNSNSGRTHSLDIYGSIINNGGVDFYYDSNDKVDIYFLGTNTTSISGSGSWDLNNAEMNLSSRTDILEVTSSLFEGALRNISLVMGTYTHSNNSTFDIDPSNDFTIEADVIVRNTAGVIKFASTKDKLTLKGTLIVDGGSIYVGDSLGKQGIRTDKKTAIIPRIEINSGLLHVYGGINAVKTSEPSEFKMSGGTLHLNSGTTGSNTDLLRIPDVSGSRFEISGGTIVFENPNNGGLGNKIDLWICGTSGYVNSTGGEIRFGNSNTNNGAIFNFKPFANVTLPKIVLDGQVSSGMKLMPSNGSTSTDNFSFLELEINPGNTFDNRSISGTNGDGKTLYLKGNFTNHGIFEARIGSVVFNGSSLQTIGGTVTTSFYNFEINNIGSSVLLNYPETINNTLTLTNGIITTSSVNTLTLGASGTTTLGSSQSYIEGTFINQVSQSGSKTIYFPIGNGGKYRPLELMINHNSASSANYQAQVVNNAAAGLNYTLPSDLSKVSTMRYWQVNRSGATNFVSATIRLYYGSDDGVTDYSSLRVATASGPAWLNLGGTGSSNTNGSILSNSFSTFNSVFTLGNSTGGMNPLPVSWIEFSAIAVKKNILLNWKTATEINCDFYEIQRSENGIDFHSIGSVKGSGTTSSLSEYRFYDDHFISGNIYYRIRQVDYDGNFSFSEIKKCTFNFPTATLAPTLVIDGAIEVVANSSIDSRMYIYDISGKLIQQIPIHANANERIRLELTNLPAGMYVACIRELDFKEKIIKN